MKKAFGLILAALGMMVGLSRPSSILCTWPRPFWVPSRHTISVPWSRWLPIQVTAEPPAKVVIDHREAAGWKSLEHRSWNFSVTRDGAYRLRYRMLGMIPWGTSWVRASSPLYVVPGGESIGIMVRTKGLIIGALQPIRSAHGIVVDPAEQAGLKVGDLITAVDHAPLQNRQELQHALTRAGRLNRSVELTVTGEHTTNVRVKPAWSLSDRSYELGASFKSGVAGVGTLTYVRPQSGQFGALGHSLTDGLTKVPAPVSFGRIMGANIIGVVTAHENHPGQKIGILAAKGRVLGRVTANGPFGIRGQLTRWPRTYLHPIPVAYPDEVHTGPATLITVLHGQRMVDYRIRIIKAFPQWRPRTKGILFEVTDPRMLAKTGGIVQGMSGSPIVQNGRLAGAVTHVMVGRPWIGYGCYAVWMMGLKPNT